MQTLAFNNNIPPSFSLKPNMNPNYMLNPRGKIKPMVIRARQTILENNMDEPIVLGKTRGFHEVIKLRGEVTLKARSGTKINVDHFRKDDDSTHHNVVKILIGEKRNDSGKVLSPMHFDIYEKIIFNPDDEEKLVVNGVPRSRPKQQRTW